MPISRREIMRGAIGSALSAPFLASIASAQTSKSTTKATTMPATRGSTTQSANDRPRFASIGFGKRGGLLGAQALKFGDIYWACDVDRDPADAFNAQHCKGKAKVTGDYRNILDDKNIDAVIIATPDHWHSKIAIDAMRAGKDVYCEKPLTLTVAEGILLCRVARETGRVFQVGTQQRSEEHWQRAVAMVQGGWLGRIKSVQCIIMKNEVGGPFPQSDPPPQLDWDMWQGQTPAVPYIKQRCHYTFRWWYEYSGGRITDWGAHYMDIAQWATAPDLPGPTSVEPVEVAHPVTMQHGYPIEHDKYNTASRFNVKCKFANGVDISIMDVIPGMKSVQNGILFTGEEASLFVNRLVIQGSAMARLKDRPIPPHMLAHLRDGREVMPHMANFVACMRDRGTPISDVFSHHRILTTCHLANIAVRLNRKFQWDATRQQIVGDSEANSFLAREQRKGYEIA